MRFRIRSLFLFVTLCALLTPAAWHYGQQAYLYWQQRQANQNTTATMANVPTVVSVPDGGTVIIGGITIRPDGSKWSQGKRIN